jgi:hypothetical protein
MDAITKKFYCQHLTLDDSINKIGPLFPSKRLALPNLLMEGYTLVD